MVTPPAAHTSGELNRGGSFGGLEDTRYGVDDLMRDWADAEINNGDHGAQLR
jgi:hypothetical protein